MDAPASTFLLAALPTWQRRGCSSIPKTSSFNFLVSYLDFLCHQSRRGHAEEEINRDIRINKLVFNAFTSYSAEQNKQGFFSLRALRTLRLNYFLIPDTHPVHPVIPVNSFSRYAFNPGFSSGGSSIPTSGGSGGLSSKSGNSLTSLNLATGTRGNAAGTRFSYSVRSSAKNPRQFFGCFCGFLGHK